MVIEMGNQVSQYFAFHTFLAENQMTNYQKINPIKNKNEITVKLWLSLIRCYAMKKSRKLDHINHLYIFPIYNTEELWTCLPMSDQT